MDAAGMAAAIGDPARAKMLYCLVDGRARTSTNIPPNGADKSITPGSFSAVRGTIRNKPALPSGPSFSR